MRNCYKISTYHLTSEDCQSLDVDNSSDLKRKQTNKKKNKAKKKNAEVLVITLENKNTKK